MSLKNKTGENEGFDDFDRAFDRAILDLSGGTVDLSGKSAIPRVTTALVGPLRNDTRIQTVASIKEALKNLPDIFTRPPSAPAPEKLAEPIKVRENAVKPEQAIQPEDAPAEALPENAGETIREADGTSLEIVELEEEENAILAEMIASYDFRGISFLPRSTAMADMLKKKMLREFCEKNDFMWKYDGKRFTVRRKPGKNFKDRTMDGESRAFVVRLLGFFGKDVEVEQLF